MQLQVQLIRGENSTFVNAYLATPMDLLLKASPLAGERFGEGSVYTFKTFQTPSYHKSKNELTSQRSRIKL